MSAAYSPFFCGVPTQMKCTSPKRPASSYEVVKLSRPDSMFLRSKGSRPGSKNGTSPFCSLAILAASTSMPMTS